MFSWRERERKENIVKERDVFLERGRNGKSMNKKAMSLPMEMRRENNVEQLAIARWKKTG